MASGYLPAAELGARIKATRALTPRAFGVNLFYPSEPSPTDRFSSYIEELSREFPVGAAKYDSDDWDAKLELLVAEPVAVVSSTFGCPSAAEIDRLHAVGTEVWVTVTTVAEARQAVAAGADVLIAQGAEAGGHRGTFVDDAADDLTDPFGLLTLVQLLRSAVDAPIVAAGGIATGEAVASVLAAGAAAAQIGTAFLRCPEAGTAPLVREAITADTPTMLTRAFTGRRARGLRNRFMLEHLDAPVAYPEIHYATGPLRAAGRAEGNADAVNLWAGQAHSLAPELPAGELVRKLSADAKNALERALSLRIQSY
ncbi:NAD(P)H-dependent flavin oxidoreductase [Nocardia seriolae]|uniref:Propionate 3-nitronate monooxygenase n=1 Tax=Nocardia seriolae TaxID=37332 RepID=A0ABC8B5A2_9NOCA|nr:nitronate monooxygenase [Nocardia seriolae]APB01677.1 Nitronate monooxygenase [Nocardia seriolae]WNJ58547.1 nitronate monooxygenase [Nocardia seriolae]BAW04156.1 2-nitropropane dioxygenase [Nocardia seriolae]BEK91268.1 nitronate monooxygenase [Nocardia seriolae]BEK93013.1 nitronate monooxygenase [Nocardia seriolae]